MPIYGLNTHDIFVKNLRLAADDSEIDDAVLTASVYDESQIKKVQKRQAATAITGASNISLTYQQGSDIEGHYRGSFPYSVGLSVGTDVLVHFQDDGTYGIDTKIILPVEERAD